jgi:nucleoid-associated protein YgaU
MKKFLLMVFSVLICIQLAGCAKWVVRISESRKPRVDQEISGNRGFILGKPTTPVKEPTFKDRKVYQVEIEIPQWPLKKEAVPAEKKSAIRPTKEDKVIWGNMGYIFTGPKEEVVEEKLVIEAVPEEPLTPIEKVKEKITQIFESKAEEETKVRTYKVAKGDTLQKISRKFYGTTKKWPLLYKANRDKLKTPDKVYPGQILVIPEAAEFKK